MCPAVCPISGLGDLPAATKLIGLWDWAVSSGRSGSEVWCLQAQSLLTDLCLVPARDDHAPCCHGDAEACWFDGAVLPQNSGFDPASPAGAGHSGAPAGDPGSAVLAWSGNEVRERVTPPGDDHLLLALQDERPAAGEWRARRGAFVVLNEYFLFVLDGGLCLAGGRRCDSGRSRTFAAFRMEPEISFGVRHGRVSWEIRWSSLHYRNGQSLAAIHGLPEPAYGNEWRQRSQLPCALRRWQVVEIGTKFSGLS